MRFLILAVLLQGYFALRKEFYPTQPPIAFISTPVNTTTLLSKDDSVILYLRVLQRTDELGMNIFTGLFRPKVDELTILLVPNSYSLMAPTLLKNTLSVSAIIKAQGKSYQLPFKLYASYNRKLMVVQSPTIHVTLEKGEKSLIKEFYL